MVMSIGFMVLFIGTAQGMICSALFSKNPVSAGYLGFSFCMITILKLSIKFSN